MTNKNLMPIIIFLLVAILAIVSMSFTLERFIEGYVIKTMETGPEQYVFCFYKGIDTKGECTKTVVQIGKECYPPQTTLPDTKRECEQ